MISRISVGPIGENVYVVRGGERIAVVDPGADPDLILDAVLAERTSGVSIACTHGHLDHTAAIGALVAGLAAEGIEARVYAHAGDAAYFGERSESENKRVFDDIRASGYFREFWIPVPATHGFLQDGDLVPGTGLRVIHTPGHTMGSVCFLEESSGDAITGDTLFRMGVGRTDTADSDGDMIMRSIVGRLLGLPDGTRIWPGHGEPSTIGAERGYFR